MDDEGLCIFYYDESSGGSLTPHRWHIGHAEFGFLVDFEGTYRAAGGWLRDPGRYCFYLSIWWVAGISAAMSVGLTRRSIRRLWRRRRDLRPFAITFALTSALSCFVITRFAIRLAKGQDWPRQPNEFLLPMLMTCAVIGAVASIETWFNRPRIAATPECAACDYNLTGNQSGYCPECGQATI